MSALLIVIHIIVCIALIMIVLLQTGKGADMGAAFGGGASNTLFGSSGASTFLSKATTAAAIVFMITSLALAYMSGHRMEGSVMTNVEATQPSNPAAPAPEAPASDQPEGGQQAAGDTASTEGQPAPAPQPAAAPVDGSADKAPE